MSSKSNISTPTRPKTFPLFKHQSGQWAKKINYKIHYFGSWRTDQDGTEARKRYLDQKDDLYAGRTPSKGEGLRLVDLVNRFLTSKRKLVDLGAEHGIKESTWYDYHENCSVVLKVFGRTTHAENLRPLDFEKLRLHFIKNGCGSKKNSKGHGVVSLLGDVRCTRALFNYCRDTFGVEVRYGQSFKPPTQAQLRRNRAKQPKKKFTAPELRKLVKAADPQLRAMILLAINCGFGNSDCANLTINELDLSGGWIEFARPKNAVPRRCPLWKETVSAIKAAIKDRPEPRDPSLNDRVFLTYFGASWEAKSIKDSPISAKFAKFMKSEAVDLYRAGRGFYALRHTFSTQGEKSRDKPATEAIMGHTPNQNDMSAVYNEDPVDDARLIAVSEYVRKWYLKSSE